MVEYRHLVVINKTMKTTLGQSLKALWDILDIGPFLTLGAAIVAVYLGVVFGGVFGGIIAFILCQVIYAISK